MGFEPSTFGENHCILKPFVFYTARFPSLSYFLSRSFSFLKSNIITALDGGASLSSALLR